MCVVSCYCIHISVLYLKLLKLCIIFVLYIYRIRHFAGPVNYSVDGFIAKNSDILGKNISSSLYKSKLPIVQSLFPEGNKYLNNFVNYIMIVIINFVLI